MHSTPDEGENCEAKKRELETDDGVCARLFTVKQRPRRNK